jgi:hypothetical protein
MRRNVVAMSLRDVRVAGAFAVIVIGLTVGWWTLEACTIHAFARTKRAVVGGGDPPAEFS